MTDVTDDLSDAADGFARSLIASLRDGRVTDEEGVALLRGALRDLADTFVPLDAVTDPLIERAADKLTAGIVKLGRRDPARLRRRAREAGERGDEAKAARLMDRALIVERKQAERALK